MFTLGQNGFNPGMLNVILQLSFKYVFKSLDYQFQQFKTSLIKLFLSVWHLFIFHFEVGKPLNLRKYLNSRNWTTASKLQCTTHGCSFKTKRRPVCHNPALVSLACESKSLAPHLGSPGHSPGEQSRRPYPQVFPRAVLSRQCPRGLPGPYCAKPVKKNTGYEIRKRSKQMSSFLETATFVPSCPWRCSPLPSLTNVQTTVQRHCPEQVVWTLGRRSRISRSFQLCT